MAGLGIVITGAGSGVGRGLAVELRKQGHQIIAADLNLDAARATVAGGGSAFQLDVSSSTSVEQFVRDLGSHRVDVLINNAGLQHVSKLEEFPEPKWDQLLDVMLKGPYLLTKSLLPRMKQQNFGRIVNVGSIHSLVASPFKSAYVAAKHGLLGLSKVVALECADVDVTINTICPAYVRTPLVDKQIADQAKTHGISEEDVVNKIMLEPMPKKAFISIEEIAATVEFLVSRHARNVTGQTIVIDGGWTVR
jgi:3-hydroxybutyrate dehydrogenase